jgi:hypothetical protein
MTRKTLVRAGRYLTLYDPEHPLASSEGYVGVHRAMFYATSGAGPHKCVWCGRTLRFGRFAGDRDNLVVDHLDGDPTNNFPANLVPACWVCNLLRGRYPHQFTRTVVAGDG